MKYLNGKQTVQSMRSSGYRSTDYAVAELIDNSIQAHATDVILAVVEKVALAKKRKTSRAQEIWVLDNGQGMYPGLAEAAVSFGGSDRYDNRAGMGRFGMGLPQSSVSQCKRTDLWTWQDADPREAVSVRIDLAEIEGGVDEVPSALRPTDPDYQLLPEWVLDLYENQMEREISGGHEATPSGTAIRWSQLDRVQWVKGLTILSHVEFLLGRIYRRFLTGEARDPDTGNPMRARVKILLLDADELANGTANFDNLREVRPNDPMHLSIPKDDVLGYFEKGNPSYAPNASADENVDVDGNPIPPLLRVEDRAPFERHHPPRTFDVVGVDGQSYPVVVRTSRVTDDGRPATVRNAGSDTHQGRHFGKNRGVSIMRANREVCMDETYYYDAPDRFWSVEVSFPPSLDEVFGVTNNKQDVPHFKELCKEVARRGDGASDDMISLLDAGDIDDAHGFAQLEPIASYVLIQVRAMRIDNKSEQDVRRQNAGRRVGRNAKVDVATTLKVKKEMAQTQPTAGERQAGREGEGKSEEERLKARQERAQDAVEAAKRQGVADDDAEVVGINYMKGLNYQILEARQAEAPAFFWPHEYGDLEIVYMNVAHPVHTELLDVLRLEDGKIAALSEEAAKTLLGRAADALGWLIHGWVRMEDNHRDLPSYTHVKTAREEWGKHLRGMLTSTSFKEGQAEAGAAALLGYDEDDE